jgi:hypothetical protein
MTVAEVAGGRDDQFRLAVMNLEHGGVRGGSDTPWRASMTVARDWNPDVVLVQEMCSPTGRAAGLRAHLWRTASELGMIPVLGPPTPQTSSSPPTSTSCANASRNGAWPRSPGRAADCGDLGGELDAAMEPGQDRQDEP